MKRKSYPKQLLAIEARMKAWERKLSLSVTKLRKLRGQYGRVLKAQAQEQADAARGLTEHPVRAFNFGGDK